MDREQLYKKIVRILDDADDEILYYKRQIEKDRSDIEENRKNWNANYLSQRVNLMHDRERNLKDVPEKGRNRVSKLLQEYRNEFVDERRMKPSDVDRVAIDLINSGFMSDTDLRFLYQDYKKSGNYTMMKVMTKMLDGRPAQDLGIMYASTDSEVNRFVGDVSQIAGYVLRQDSDSGNRDRLMEILQASVIGGETVEIEKTGEEDGEEGQE